MGDYDSLPDVSFNAVDVKNLSAKKVLSEGWYQFVITGLKKKEKEGVGALTISAVCKVINPEDGQSVLRHQAYYAVHIPLQNPNYPEFKVLDYQVSLFSQFLGTVRPAVYPRRPKKGSGGQWEYKGESIDPSTLGGEGGIYAERMEAMLTEAVKFWQDPSQLEDELFYGKIVHNKNFVNINNLCTVLPDDAALVPPEEMIVTQTEGEDE